jgi:hypothetical protein
MYDRTVKFLKINGSEFDFKRRNLCINLQILCSVVFGEVNFDMYDISEYPVYDLEKYDGIVGFNRIPQGFQIVPHDDRFYLDMFM